VWAEDSSKAQAREPWFERSDTTTAARDSLQALGYDFFQRGDCTVEDDSDSASRG